LKDSVVNEDFKNLSKVDKEKRIRKYRTEMEKAAKSLDFVEAARIRDIIKLLKK
jgi:excinuclease ABC subunit B